MIITRKFFRTSLCVICILFIIQNTLLSQWTTLRTQADVDAFDPATTIISGDLSIGEINTPSDISDISNLSNLIGVSGRIFIRNTQLSNLDDLSNLTNIGGEIIISQNPSLMSIPDFPELDSIFSIEIISNDALVNLGFNNVHTVEQAFEIGNNNALLNFNGFSNLKSVSRFEDFYFYDYFTIHSNDALLDLDGLSGLTTLNSSFSISNNNSLKSLEGLSNITESNSLSIIGNDALENLFGINVQSINGLLSIKDNPILEDLDNLLTVTNVATFLQIINNNSLKSIEGLSNLHEADFVTIEGNDALESLTGLNIGSIGVSLNINDNISLRNCCPIYKLLYDPTNIDFIVNISGNPAPCSKPEDITEQGCYFAASNHNYHLSGISNVNFTEDDCDDNGKVSPYLRFIIEDDAGITGYTFGNSLGRHDISFPEGTFTIQPQNEFDQFFEISPKNVQVTFPGNNSPYLQDFCITSIIDTTHISLNIIPLDQARPGFDSRYKIIMSNVGTLPVSGQLKYTYQTEVMDYIGTSGDIVMEDIGEILWDIMDLQPLQSLEYLIEFNLNRPTEDPALIGGEILDFNASFENTANNGSQVFDAHITQEVVNSFDPNDKQCLEGNILTPEMIGNYVHYMIRFENTGTADAINVAVTDRIDTEVFDINTLEITDASHEMETRISDGNLVEFIFRDINLPFEDDTNDGYLVFRIKTSSDLVVGDEISNTADIFFDFNPPITTNTSISRFQSLTSILQVDFTGVEVYPNPAKEILYIDNNSLRSLTYNIYNSLGQRQSVEYISGTIDLSGLTNGTYLLQLIDTDTKESILKKITVVR